MLEYVIAGLAVAVLIILPALVTGLKGRYGLLLIGFVIPGVVVWVIGALRLARPGSFWERRFYSPEKRRRSLERHRDHQGLPS